MTNKNEATLVIVAIIGAFGVILAACIGLIPTILPMVRPTSTPFIFSTATVMPSETPAPETPSATFAPPTDTQTATETVPPLITDTVLPTENPTITPTFEAASSNVDDYIGTWVNVENEPTSDKVKMVVTRMEITKTSNTTADFSVCRATQSGEMYVEPNPSQATIYDFGLVARSLTMQRYPNLKWSVLVQPSGDELVATVQEYDENNIILNSDIFRLQKSSLIGSIALSPCQQPPTQ
jgi:hypothetical protein